MSRPIGNLDTTFASFLPELAEDYRERAIQFQAFCRSRQIKTPEPLMPVVMGYWGIDEVLRETAGNCTRLGERLSDTAIHQRLKAGGRRVKAVLGRMMGDAAKPLLDGQLRLRVVDGSTGQGPGAKGTAYRPPMALDLVRLPLVHGKVTAEHAGAHRGHYPLQNGEVVVMDRGDNQAQRWIDQADPGVSMVVRYHPPVSILMIAKGRKPMWRRYSGRRARWNRACPSRFGVKKRGGFKALCTRAGYRRRQPHQPAGGRGPKRARRGAPSGHPPWPWPSGS
jgi:hypothetical protein